MSRAGRARIGAYVTACLIAAAAQLIAGRPSLGQEITWREAVQRVEAVLAGGDLPAARRHWEEAYRMTVRARTAEGLLAVGQARLHLGEVTGGRQSAVADARRIYLSALFQARERRDADGVALAGRAFGELGDREVADRAFAVAAALATRSRDSATREPILARAGRDVTDIRTAP
jgi:hypothetical protein